MAPSDAVLGFRPHTYWTAAVALAGPAEAPRVLVRRRIVFAEGAERSVYHQAAEAPAGSAPALLERVRAATTAKARREIARLVADLAADGVRVRRAVTAAASAKLPARIEDIVASHSRIHTAEGSFYRDVVAAACAAAGLEVVRVEERELLALVCDLLACDRTALASRLQAMGRALGPPWSVDQKLATQAAWLQLA